MNEETPNPFDTVGDAPVEARIVAWVLGEASAFEAAELARLCEENPELLVFHRRMLTLHGLLAEAESSEADPAWKLSSAKRGALDEILGPENVIPLDSQKELRVRRAGRRAIFGIAACLVLAVVVLQLVRPVWRHQLIMAPEKKVDFMPPGGAGGVAMQDANDRGSIDIIGGTSFKFDMSRSDGAKREDTLSASEEMIRDQKGAATSSAARPGTYKVDSAAVVASREPGLQQAARQNQLAKQVPKPRVIPDAPLQVGDHAVISESETMPPVALDGMASGLGGGRSIGMDKALPVSPTMPSAPADPAPAASPSRAEGRALQGGVAMAGPKATGERFKARLSGSFDDIASESKANEQMQLEKNDKPPVLAGKVSEMPQVPAKGRLFLSRESAEYGEISQLNEGENPGPANVRDSGANVSLAAREMERRRVSVSESESLSQVDKTKELAVPPNGIFQRFGGFVNYGSPIQEGAKNAPADADEMKIQREIVSPSESGELPSPVTKSKDQEVFPTTSATPDSFKSRNAVSSIISGSRISVEPVAPKPDLAELMEEIPAVENPYSTFSLNISDASFQMARAALAKGERPDPASIKPEQFYNAVDYGDPAPTANEPVAATIEQSAHPFIPGRNLVRVALRTGSVGRSAAQPLRLTLLVDQSGSMAREDRRAAMDHALAQLGGLLTKNDLVSVVGFSRTSRLLADGLAGDQCTKLGGLVNLDASEGGTNLEEALKIGRQMAERHQLAGAQNRIVLFTDGAANLGDADPARLAGQVKALRQNGIAFDIAGIGADGLNDRLLGEMARNGNGRYYVVGSEKNDSFARQLAGAFRPAAENVKVQVIFNPQRVGKYKLIGFEKDRLKTEDFRNDAVDAAELAADEAGVAIYQVEPLAEGSGELGEVSVRFRDAAGGQMVERSWTIPHDARATAFDRATPSMQLAGLSLFAAEKLRGGPLADAIDFQQLVGSTAFVKQFYGNSPRVSDMLQVIEKLK